MYVTRPLSLYKRSPDAIHEQPPEGPGSGYLVVQDDESMPTCCFGACVDPTIEGLPLPQNKRIDVLHGSGESETSYSCFFVPVVGLPLSANRYYAVKADGRRHKGEVYASAKEETMVNCLGCCFCGPDEKPRALDPTDTYQQVIISYTPHWGNNYFSAKSVAEDGVLPSFLRSNPWGVRTYTPNFNLYEANGINSSLRDHLPSIELAAPVVVGKWYCPFMFIKEKKPKDQMKKSMFYGVKLEQRWEMIFSCENEHNARNSDMLDIVTLDVNVPTHQVKIAGIEAIQDIDLVDDGMVWFKISNAEEDRVGLSTLVMDRIIWEQERVGWVTNKEKQTRVARVEEYGMGPWRKFGCYVLVESFVFRRMDGSLVLSYDFFHSRKTIVKWD